MIKKVTNGFCSDYNVVEKERANIQAWVCASSEASWMMR